MDSKPTHVVFTSIHPRFEIIVPTAEAWGFYDSISRTMHAAYDQMRALKVRREERRDDSAQTVSQEYLDRCLETDTKLLIDQGLPISVEVSQVIWDGDTKLRSFASGRFVWDFESRITRLSGIAIGAYGVVSLHSPMTEGRKVTQHYVGRDWVWGINWDRRTGDYLKEFPLEQKPNISDLPAEGFGGHAVPGGL